MYVFDWVFDVCVCLCVFHSCGCVTVYVLVCVLDWLNDCSVCSCVCVRVCECVCLLVCVSVCVRLIFRVSGCLWVCGFVRLVGCVSG